MSLWHEDDEGPFSVDPTSGPYDWSTDGPSESFEYCRVIRPKRTWRARYNQWRFQRWLDGDFGFLENLLQKGLVFPAGVVGVYVVVFLVLGFTVPAADEMRLKCFAVLAICVGLIGLKYSMLWMLRLHIANFGSRYTDQRWLITDSYDESETDDG